MAIREEELLSSLSLMAGEKRPKGYLKGFSRSNRSRWSKKRIYSNRSKRSLIISQ